MLNFKPVTEEEALGLMPVGTYNFQVAFAENAVSKAGNEMIKLTLTVWDNAGKEHNIFDYLMEALAYKLRHFCDATGLEDKYQQGKFDANDCINKTGTCKIKIDEGSGGYGPKNVVQDYVKGATSSTPGSDKADKADKDAEFFNDDLPF